MLSSSSEPGFSIKSINNFLDTYLNLKPKYTGGSNSSILVFTFKDAPGHCPSHNTFVPFFESINSKCRYKQIAGNTIRSGRMNGNEISFLTSGITYETQWDDPLNYTLLGINPSFFSRFFESDSVEPFSILFDKLSDDEHIISLISKIIEVALKMCPRDFRKKFNR